MRAWTAGWPGVLLADDMGLGKSFQALAFMAWIKAHRTHCRNKAVLKKGPTLIVAPTALLENWLKEARKHLAPNALGRDIANVLVRHTKVPEYRSGRSSHGANARLAYALSII